MTFDLVVIFVLLVANGLFAMAEIALVASRRVRLEHRAAEGDVRAAAALRLKEHPTDFLSTVQVGITLIGIVAGAYSGSTLAEPLAAVLQPLPVVGPYASTVAFVVVVAGLTYFSLVIGELVPKAIALNHPESRVSMVAQPFALLARVASPLVRLLSASTQFVLWVLRIKPVDEPHPTEEEIRSLIKQATHAGELEVVEQQIVDKVFHLADRSVASLMTPRVDIDWIDVQETDDVLRAQLASQHHARLLVCENELDRVVGIVYAEDLLAEVAAGRPFDLRTVARQPLFVPETVTALALFERFRSARSHTGLIVDEYGSVQGIVTLTDVLEGLFGALPDQPLTGPASIVARGDGSYLVDGDIALDELRVALSLPGLTEEEAAGQFHTLAGLIMTRLSRLPAVGDAIVWHDYRLEVVDMDSRRVDKVLVAPLTPKQPA